MSGQAVAPTQPKRRTSPAPFGRNQQVFDELGRLFSDRPTRDAFERGMEMLDRHAGVGRAALFRIALPHQGFVVEASYGAPRDQFRPHFHTGVAGRVAEAGKPLVVPVVRQDPMALSELADPVEWGDLPWCLVALPLFSRSQSWGVFSAYFRNTEAGGFDGRLRTLGEVARLIEAGLTPGESPDVQEPAGPASSPEAPHVASVFEYSNMIGSSAAMRQVYEQIGQVACTNATALLRGESGTGKELVARAIHENSPRSSQPFVKVNCAALPESLFESELFGHERGAFTGAQARRKGRFELAHGGTLFLDEIAEISLVTQAKLLRVLQFREFERLGGSETLRADVRIVAATNRDLEQEVARGAFREDLYYRMNVFSMTLPSLRHRRADIPALAEYFLDKFAREHDRKITRISSGALDVLSQHGWPGNVRELENAIERAVVVCGDSVVREHHLPEALRDAQPETADEVTLAGAVESLEKRMITSALRNEHGNASRAARALGTSERVLRYKANKYGIDAARFRRS